MEGNSPGRKKSSLSSKVNFFEQVWTRPPPSSDRNEQPGVMSEAFDQASVDELERQMRERRREMMAASQQSDHRPMVTLRSVTSPAKSPTEQQSYTSEVFVSSWTDRVKSPSPQGDPVVHPPWRLARRSEPSSSPEPSSFGVPTSPTLALNKYQEWRARRLTDSSAPDTSVPWRRQAQRSNTSDSVFDFQRSRQSSESELSVSSGSNFSISSRKFSQPQWYSEFRTASNTQAATRLDTFRPAINTHYDYHISQIKGIPQSRFRS